MNFEWARFLVKPGGCLRASSSPWNNIVSIRIASALSFALFIFVSCVFFTPRESSAMPNFSRQMKVSCSTCHYQHVPKLNAFGRDFQLGGYTDVSEDLKNAAISTLLLSRASLIPKARYIAIQEAKTGGVVKNSDSDGVDISEESALWLGGRVVENLGFIVGFRDAGVSGKMVLTMKTGSARLGLSIYSTDSLSPAFGMDIFNSGVTRLSSPLENRNETVIAQQTGVGAGAATGLTAYISHKIFFGSVGLWSPEKAQDTSLGSGVTDMAFWFRFAVMPKFSDVDLMIGIFGSSGDAKCAKCIGASNNDVDHMAQADSFGVDVQLQTNISGMTLETQLMYVSAGSDDPLDPNVSNLYKKADGVSAIAELGLGKTYGVSLAYRSYTDKSGYSDVYETATTIGGWINLAENIHIQPQYTLFGGDKDKVGGKNAKFTLLLLAGF